MMAKKRNSLFSRYHVAICFEIQLSSYPKQCLDQYIYNLITLGMILPKNESVSGKM